MSRSKATINVKAGSAPSDQPAKPAPAAPSFGLCAGTVADLAQVEKTVDPFTGRTVTRADLG